MGHSAPPGLDLSRFYCLFCRNETDQDHFDLQGIRGRDAVTLPNSWAVAACVVCHTVTLFYEGEQIIPPRLHGEFNGDGLPREIAEEIRCALKTLHSSPRASAAHARTALYAMLSDVAAADDDDTPPPADVLFERLVPAEQTTMHASFRDTCLRGGVLVPAGVQQGHEPRGVASALLDLLRMARDLFYPPIGAA